MKQHSNRRLLVLAGETLPYPEILSLVFEARAGQGGPDY
jgi:hypothetical protein